MGPTIPYLALHPAIQPEQAEVSRALLLLSLQSPWLLTLLIRLLWVYDE